MSKNILSKYYVKKAVLFWPSPSMQIMQWKKFCRFSISNTAVWTFHYNGGFLWIFLKIYFFRKKKRMVFRPFKFEQRRSSRCERKSFRFLPLWVTIVKKARFIVTLQSIIDHIAIYNVSRLRIRITYNQMFKGMHCCGNHKFSSSYFLK